jgi:DNA recombination protein RmuC
VETLIVILLVALIAAVLLIGLRIAKPQQAPAVQTPQVTVTAPPLPVQDIVSAVQAAINATAISSDIRGAVSAEILEVAQRALQSNTELLTVQAGQVLETQQGALDARASALLTPLQTQLNSLDTKVGELRSSYENEQGQMKQALTSIATLQDSTNYLNNVLTSNVARGAWGEQQLETVLTISGMTEYCDFATQEGATGGGRPDVTVKLPTGGRIAIDSKFVLGAYSRAVDPNVDSATAEREMKQHARDIKNHAAALSGRKYWESFGHDSPDFVVMFIPGESFLSDALKVDPDLMAHAMTNRVLLASPMNLLAMLLTIAKGWQAVKINEQADQVRAEAEELYRRSQTMLNHVVTLGNGLTTANNAYDSLVGSIQGRLLVTLRNFKTMGAIQENTPLVEVSQLGHSPRILNAPELTDFASDDGN